MALFLAACLADIAYAGEIAGMRAQLPPTVDPDVAISFSNDFLGRGGSVDDFRTTQIIVSSRFGDRWLAVLDHSTLTLEDELLEGRVDQLSLSVGYRLLDRVSGDNVTRLAVGSGLRSTGDIYGERMQNGFHRIIGSEISDLPYVDTDETEATAWVDADQYGTWHETGNWRHGYWVRGSSLATTGGRWDNSLGAYLVSSRNWFDIWIGARRDWRSGYDDDFVQNATADAEDDLAYVLGVRFGALVLETVQQANNDASYGQLKLVADGRRPFPASGSWPRLGIEFAFIVPDVQLALAAKYRGRWLLKPSSNWRESILLDIRYGEPQYRDDNSLYNRTQQLSLGIEFERQLSVPFSWISGYSSFAVGWRTEQLLGDGQLSGQQSESAGQATGLFNGGLRFNAAQLGGGWHYRLQLGVTGWIPVDSSTVSIAGQDYRLHKSGYGISLGMSFDYD